MSQLRQRKSFPHRTLLVQDISLLTTPVGGIPVVPFGQAVPPVQHDISLQPTPVGGIPAVPPVQHARPVPRHIGVLAGLSALLLVGVFAWAFGEGGLSAIAYVGRLHLLFLFLVDPLFASVALLAVARGLTVDQKVEVVDRTVIASLKTMAALYLVGPVLEWVIGFGAPQLAVASGVYFGVSAVKFLFSTAA